MFQSTRVLDLPLIQMGQAQKHVTHNEALLKLDTLVQPVAADLDRTDPPAAPQEGDRHLVAGGAAGAWAGQDGAIATFANGGWMFQTPQPGWKVHVLAADADAVFDGSAWQVREPGQASAPTQGSTLGLNAPADETNRLTVAAEATLLTHDGAGHQLKVNKAAEGDTNSLLFQTGFSGRAEMGCTGEDDFSVKVSADGTAWTEALRLDSATGRMSGAAVAGLVGTVAQSGGVPTGDLIESGTTADGSYVRFADGFQICTHVIDLGFMTDYGTGEWSNPYRSSNPSWTFPAAFATPPALSINAVVDGGTGARRAASAGCKSVDTVSASEIQAYRISSAGNADAATATVVAFGRWY